ncbi:MAG TPA: hypothetical protein VJT75_16290 [Thermoleophilaceae bacterium]|nr:hypothetical protein [Thermoleophilaceae bacterium]
MSKTAQRATILGSAIVASLAAAPSAFAASSPPAGGAEISQVIIATTGAMIATGALLAIVIGHRSGKLAPMKRLVTFSENVSGMPAWSAIPLSMLGGTLLIAVFGMYWDISIHIDKGRDPGPLANAAHYFILVGLFGVMFSGVLAMALPLEKPSRSAIRLPNGWQAPLGGVIISVCGAISLLAFPLDDIWHRIFGQDVTLWGPTHLLLFGGAAFSVVGAWILHREGKSASLKEPPDVKKPIFLARYREPMLAGAFLIGLSTFQGEFDFAVPQYNLVFHPMLLMIAAGVGLVAARLRLGRGGALKAALFFILIRGLLFLTVGLALPHTDPKFPLYIAEALAVEGVALFFPRGRPIAFGAVAGAAIGTFGLAGEWAWSHVFWTIEWPSALLPEGAILGFVGAIAGGILGGFVGRSLSGGAPEERVPRVVVPAAAALIAVMVGYALQTPEPSKPPVATVTLQDVKPAPKREVRATVKVDPPSAAKDHYWFNATAWQGGGSVVAKMEPTGQPGVYTSPTAIPVYGNWKATLRLAKDNHILGSALYFPSDPAIPAPAVPAKQQFTRPFMQDKKLLQREQKSGTSGALTAMAYTVVLLVALVMFGLLAWGLVRLSKTLRQGKPEPPAPDAPSQRPRDRTAATA